MDCAIKMLIEFVLLIKVIEIILRYYLNNREKVKNLRSSINFASSKSSIE